MRNATAQQRMRVAGWYGDMDAVRAIAATLPIDEADGFSNYATNYARALTGAVDKATVDAMTLAITTNVPSPRFYTLMCQAATEIYAARGCPEDALHYFLKAADSVLIDIEWTDRCPSLKASARCQASSRAVARCVSACRRCGAFDADARARGSASKLPRRGGRASRASRCRCRCAATPA
jgi:hypothetical protein